jgi:hypothetical protein
VLIAVDTNVLLDQAAQTEDVLDAVAIIKRRIPKAAFKKRSIAIVIREPCPMRHQLSVFLALCAVPALEWSGYAQNSKSPSELRWESSDKSIKIHAKAERFNPNGHRVESAKTKQLLSSNRLDGYAVVGSWEPAEGDWHLGVLKIEWKGKAVPMPAAAFQSIFNPHLESVSEGLADNKDVVRVRRSDDGKSLLLVIPVGGDASRLDVALVINKQGVVARFLISGEL